MKKTLYPDFGVLLVDDESSWLRTISMTLAIEAGVTNVYRCSDSREVRGILSQNDIGLVLLDLNMPHISGMDLLAMVVEEFPQVSVIVVSGMNQVDTAVKSMKKGALDFFVKTDDVDRLIKGVQRALRSTELERENRQMRSRFFTGALENPELFEELVTRSSTMFSVFQYIEAIAVSSRPVLITGESGVGKELVARAIHKASRRSGPLVSVNVAGLDDNIFSSTLFGHKRGAYTGAEESRGGMVEQAAYGTLFLDEIGDLSIASQVKLLRLLQEGEYFPLGSDVVKRMNARVIVATHQDLAASQAEGRLRKDLYYRLCGHHVHIPPLRERKEDIALLLDLFLAQAAKEFGKKMPSYPKELIPLLENYSFPGNIREFKGMVFDAMTLHKSRMLSMDAFKRVIDGHAPVHDRATLQTNSVFNDEIQLPSLKEVASLLVVEAMKRSRGNQSLAARLLGISQPALSKRLKKLSEE
ncbi:sigma-54-dependent transcriptional regulator [Desulfosediminicola ganghwensis]|uniref:sigma-54-dependent transcriptional regulator n=1 Tax=Desulfosediminicola ganghwensis TaxID=2569540 RepID=UPI0010AD4333|nr:sigma-54 dependent transcriptional regulator [Desulfosediminicola ganghwensis]